MKKSELRESMMAVQILAVAQGNKGSYRGRGHEDGEKCGEVHCGCRNCEECSCNQPFPISLIFSSLVYIYTFVRTATQDLDITLSNDVIYFFLLHSIGFITDPSTRDHRHT